jgi:N6-L-threonylcarbamoyladenine synthase
MKQRVALGIDTSAYTTSLAVVGLDGELLDDERQVLAVPPGQRGLRQAEAVYQHVRSLPLLFTAAFSPPGRYELAAVAVSERPRPYVDSFMPVFMAGAGAAAAAAAAAGLEPWAVSHQEGHLWAGLWSLPPGAAALAADRLLAAHLSGGTTEVLLVEGLQRAGRPQLRLLAATGDISAGQLVDRIGVKLGLQFPAGAALQELAAGGRPERVRLPPAVAGRRLSFSGPEAAALRAIAAGAEPADVAAAVFACLSEALARWLGHLAAETGVEHVLLAGGVAASTLLRRDLAARRELSGLALWFADPAYSGDNAVGLAAWAAAQAGGLSLPLLPRRGLRAVP